MKGIGVIVLIVLIVVVAGIPSYVIGRRRGVESPGLAFVPGVGPILVLLWSIGRSGWLTVVAFIPLVGIVFEIWLAIVIPQTHKRSGWWAVALIFTSIIGLYFYAFTLEPESTPAT